MGYKVKTFMNDKTGWCANMFDTNKYVPILEVRKKTQMEPPFLTQENVKRKQP